MITATESVSVPQESLTLRRTLHRVLVMMRKAWLAVFLIPCAMAAGCADMAQWMRRRTYAPDFRYLTREKVGSAMEELAYHTRELNRLMRGPETPLQGRSEIIENLQAMERAAGQLDQSGWPTNHPLIDMNLANFLRDIRFARESVERDPPNFLLAGSLMGACVYCHGGR